MLKNDERVLILRHQSVTNKIVKILQMEQDQRASLEFSS